MGGIIIGRFGHLSVSSSRMDVRYSLDVKVSLQ